MKHFLAIALIFCSLNGMITAQGPCIKRNSCSCTYSNNKTIDLSPLAFNNETARWSYIWDTYYSSRYSYNPCYNFTESTCVNASVCQFDGDEHYALGSQNSVQFITDSATGYPAIVYNSTNNLNVTRITQVVLVCVFAGPDVLKAIGELDPTHYSLELTSTHSCPN